MATNIDIIVAILADRAVVIDAAAGEGFQRGDVAGSTTSTLGALFKAKPLRRGSRVLVFSHDFFTQVVRLPEQQAAGMAAQELQTALAFEVEPFSGITADKGAVAYAGGAAEAGVRSWQVLQVANSELTVLQGVVRDAGGRLAGVAAVGGAQQALSDTELATTLLQWAADGGVPIIRPQVRKMVSGSRELIVGFVFLLTCAICLGHFFYAKARLERLQRELREAQREAAVNNQISSSNTVLRRQIDDITKRRARRNQAGRTMARYRDAWSVLMRGLMTTSSESVVIRGISSGQIFEADIKGVCVSEHEPGDYLVRLAAAIADSGWQLNTATIAAPSAPGGEGPRSFTFRATLDFPGFVRPGSASLDSDLQLW